MNVALCLLTNKFILSILQGDNLSVFISYFILSVYFLQYVEKVHPKA